MITIAVTFDSQKLSQESFSKITQGGMILGGSGLLNLQWEEFSALDAARELDLHGVVWEATRDDTPGSLTCLIRYDTLALTDLQKRLLDPAVLDCKMHQG